MPAACIGEGDPLSPARALRASRMRQAGRCRRPAERLRPDRDPSAASQAMAGATTAPSSSWRGRRWTTSGPGSIEPVRSFGPGRSTRIGTCRPAVLAQARTCEAIAVHAARSSWAELIRAQSIPAPASERTRSRSDEASLGSVTMIRVSRFLRRSPNSARVRWRRRALLSSNAIDVAGLAAVGASVASHSTISSTCSIVARTCASLRPREESPSRASAA